MVLYPAPDRGPEYGAEMLFVFPVVPVADRSYGLDAPVVSDRDSAGCDSHKGARRNARDTAVGGPMALREKGQPLSEILLRDGRQTVAQQHQGFEDRRPGDATVLPLVKKRTGSCKVSGQDQFAGPFVDDADRPIADELRESIRAAALVGAAHDLLIGERIGNHAGSGGDFFAVVESSVPQNPRPRRQAARPGAGYDRREGAVWRLPGFDGAKGFEQRRDSRERLRFHRATVKIPSSELDAHSKFPMNQRRSNTP